MKSLRRMLHWSSAFIITMITIFVSVLIFPTIPNAAAANLSADCSHAFVVSIYTVTGWQVRTTLSFDQFISEKTVDLSGLELSQPPQVRLHYCGDTAAYIDQASLDGSAPIALGGSVETQPLALQKLSARDQDLIDAQGETLTLSFEPAAPPRSFTLAARIEPRYMTKVPFRYPLQAGNAAISPTSTFYTYVWDSQRATLPTADALNLADLGEPFFKVFTHPTTGHPDGFAYAWLRNDGDHLYVIIDLTPDNTQDGDLDYTKVFINTPTGIKEFKLTVSDTTWGAAEFRYTPNAVYQHKVYRFALPAAGLGLGSLAPGQKLQFAIEAYGTMATLPYLPKIAAENYMKRPGMWIPNGQVNALALAGDTLYIGGIFDRLGSPTGNFVALDPTSGALDTTFPGVSGYVSVIAADGFGGWFIGGNFTGISGVPRPGLAHILADKSLDLSWDPQPDGPIAALAVRGTTVYVGGNFTHVGGQERKYLAALDATAVTSSTAVTAWTCNANGIIRSLVISDTVLYAGGLFSSIGDHTRQKLAALDITNNAHPVTDWDPNTDTAGTIYALAIQGNTLYAGGSYASIGGANHRGLAALDTTQNSNMATPWLADTGIAETVLALSLHNGFLFAGGTYSAINGISRKNLAAIDTAQNSNNVTAWDPQPDSSLAVLAVQGDVLYAGGYFKHIGVQVRNGLAAFDLTTNANSATGWDPDPNNTATLALAADANRVYAGGGFTSIGGVNRKNLAAINVISGMPTPWNPGADNIVNTLAVSGTTVYAAGGFHNLGGATRDFIGALDTTLETNNATAWNPSADSTVLKLVLHGSTLYAAGYFNKIGGGDHFSLAALDTTQNTNNVLDWNPNPNFPVQDLAMAGSTLYTYGVFTNIGGQPRRYLAALDTTVATNNATGWDPNPDGPITSLLLDGTTLYTGGYFNTIGGQSRHFLASLDTTLNTNNATAFDPQPSFIVSTMALHGNSLYTGGTFNHIDGLERNFLAGINTNINTHNVLAWDPNPDGPVIQLLSGYPAIFATGYFNGINNYPQAQLTKLVQPSHITATTSLNPARFRDRVIWTATVTSTELAPGGMVTFTIDAATQISATLASTGPNSASASIVMPMLTVGTHTVEVSYGGAEYFVPAQGQMVGGQTIIPRRLFLPYVKR